MININNQETGSSIHSRIIRQHEREVVKTLRELEKTTRKLACWKKNCRHFNTRCLHDNVIPYTIDGEGNKSVNNPEKSREETVKHQNFSVPFYGEQITR